MLTKLSVHSTTQVKPSRVGLGTGWVTSYKYLVVKCVLYPILFLNAKINEKHISATAWKTNGKLKTVLTPKVLPWKPVFNPSTV